MQTLQLPLFCFALLLCVRDRARRYLFAEQDRSTTYAMRRACVALGLLRWRAAMLQGTCRCIACRCGRGLA